MIRFIIISIILVFSAIYGCSGKFISKDDKKAIEVLSQHYKSDNWEIRRKAISHVCQYDSSKAIDLLITALDDVHSIVRIEALDCIGYKRPNKAKRILRQIAESDNDNNVRLNAIRSLAKYRDSTAAPIFVKGLDSDDWLIREESIKGLLTIDDIFIKQISIPNIIRALNDPRINVKLATLNYLNVRNKNIFNELSAIINKDENINRINLLKAALKAIHGYLLDKKTRERLIEFLTHPNTEIRILSLGILKKDKELQEKELQKL